MRRLTHNLFVLLSRVERWESLKEPWTVFKAFLNMDRVGLQRIGFLGRKILER